VKGYKLICKDEYELKDVERKACKLGYVGEVPKSAAPCFIYLIEEGEIIYDFDDELYIEASETAISIDNFLDLESKKELTHAEIMTNWFKIDTFVGWLKCIGYSSEEDKPYIFNSFKMTKEELAEVEMCEGIPEE